eukprot:COSAG03_NODE_19791_length_330_cov_0.528139_1_plen_67_part_01
MKSYPTSQGSDGHMLPPQLAPGMQLIGLRVPDAARSGMGEFIVNTLVFGASNHLEKRQSGAYSSKLT